MPQRRRRLSHDPPSAAADSQPTFRLLTKESMTSLAKRVRDSKMAKDASKQRKRLETTAAAAAASAKTDHREGATEHDNTTKKTQWTLKMAAGEGHEDGEGEKPKPNPALEAGKQLPSKLGEFPPELIGKPIEELDEYYFDKYTFVVVARDRTIFRFSASNGLLLLSPFSPIRRASIYILTHPFFSLSVMVVILVNCVFMASTQEIPSSEATFTGIYTVESTVKILARGFILSNFTYLRDAWNWLDFIVVSLAYITLAFPLGNLAALRTFRVLRALKTVAVVPGLKTIVGALMEAVRRLRDVMILTVFVLSIFALVGLQIYQGTLRNKCVLDPDPGWKANASEVELQRFYKNESNWLLVPMTGLPKLCGNNSDTGKCPDRFVCLSVGPNPNFDFTSFDNFGFALLCAFRLMTQDCWENLYQMILTTNGPYHIIFFIIVIFMGSFYLVNLILAIVAMSYDDCQKLEKEEDEAEALEQAMRQARNNDYNDEDDDDDDYDDGNDDDCVEEPGVDSDDEFPVDCTKSLVASTSDVTARPDDVIEISYHVNIFGVDQRDVSVGSTERRLSGMSHFKGGMSHSLSGSQPISEISLVSPHANRPSATGHHFHWISTNALSLTPTPPASYFHPTIVNPFPGSFSPTIPIRKPMASDPSGAPSISTGAPLLMGRPEVRRPSHSMYSIANSQQQQQQQQVIRSGSLSMRASVMSPMHRLQVPDAFPSPSPSPRHSIATAGDPSTRRSTTIWVSGGGGDRKPVEPTFFRWNAFPCPGHRKRGQPQPTAEAGNQMEEDDEEEDEKMMIRNESATNEAIKEATEAKETLFKGNPFVCHTPSLDALQLTDVQVLKELVNEASGKSGESLSWKEKLKAACFHLFFGWECFPCWYRFARIVELFVMDAFVDLFITVCIIINTIFMAMDHADMSQEMTRALAIGNYVFTAIFTAEALLKILALGLYRYLKDRWNCFDIVIVALSLVELGLANVKGLSILRSFRLLRVFKLAKSWPTLNLLIGIIGRTMGALGNLCFVLAIIIFIFAVMGMQLFGENYGPQSFSEVPRWNFCDFFHSFMIIFRVLCGEWIESMWDCIHCAGLFCIPFFLLTMIIGNLVVLNLFLALLLSSFGAESLQKNQDETEPNKLQEAVDRILRFVAYLNSHLLVCIYFRLKKKSADEQYDVAFAKIDFSGKIWFRSGHVSDFGVTESPRQMMSSSLTQVTKDVSSGEEEEITTKFLRNFSKSNISSYTRVSSKDTKEDGDEEEEEKEEREKRVLIENEACGDVICKGEDYRSPTRRTVRMTSSSLSPHSGNDDRTPSGERTTPSSASHDDDDSSSSSHSFRSASLNFDDEDEEEDGEEEDDEDTLSIRCIQEASSLEPPEVNEVNVVFVRYPDDCCPSCFTNRCRKWIVWSSGSGTGKRFWQLRCLCYSVVDHRYFETFIIAMILASSISLAIEDVDINSRPTLKFVLHVLDRIFTVIFVLEMFVKLSAYGFRKYFTDAWCWLDFVIVAISLLSLGAEGVGLGNMGAFRALRTLRALRPLRAVSRWEGMKVVVNALIQAIPAICNVLLVCLVFWLIFSIMGVNLFGGRFSSCRDPEGAVVNASLVHNRSQCDEASASLNFTWENPKINFDNVLVAYLALFQVATFKGWTDIMSYAIDSKESGMQPEYENRVYMYLYFVFFIVFGSFFTLNLFIGVIIDNFNMQKKKAGGSMQLFMTEDQKKYYNAMKKLGSKQPQKPIPRPKLKCSMFLFNLTTNQKFDVTIMIVILLNMLTMAMEYEDMPEEMSSALGIINQVFVAIFTTECVMKLIALRLYYFKQPWNVFDFVVVVMSILCLAMKQIIEKYFVSPTLLRVVRVFRVGRILRLIKSAKGIRTLLFSLAVSLPALFNIGLLLFLIMFIYAIFGMSFFMHVTYNNGIEELFNFETFGRSVILLFQVSTSAGWNSVLAGLMIEPPKCNGTSSEDRPYGNCGSSAIAVLYLVTYLVISFLVVINMYIAVILENFSQATEDVQQGLTQDDFDMYFEVWERYDEAATQYIPLDAMSDLADALEYPLRLPAPNFFKLVAMDIPICEGDRVQCVDLLDALTKSFLGTFPEAGREVADVHKKMEKKDYCPISSTLRRQREIYCAKVIQRAWRSYLDRKRWLEQVGAII